MALVTVVVPVYNVEAYLGWCLDSLCQQTLDDIEIIAVNDGSTDGSLDILKTYAEKDARIRIIDKENGGLSSARNEGIRAATAPVVCFLDSDDRFTPDACARIVAAFDETDNCKGIVVKTGCTENADEENEDVPVDVVTFGANCYPDSLGYPWLREHLSPRDVTYEPFHIDLIAKEMSRPFAWRTACRTSFLGEHDIVFDEDVRFGEDQVFHFAIYPRARKTRLISDKLYDYRISREGSLMERAQSNRPQMMCDHIQIMRVIFDDWSDAGFLDQYAEYMASWTVEFALYDILSLPLSDRMTLLQQARDFLLSYWNEDRIMAMDLKPATRNILRAALHDNVVGNGQAKRLQLAYYVQQYGIVSALKGIARRVRG